MNQPHIIQEENEIKKITGLILRNYKLFMVCIIVAIGLAYAVNKYSIPVYKISSSILIKEDSKQGGGKDVSDFLNSSLLRVNQNFQNELRVLKSSPIIEQTIKNLDLSVSYYHKEGYQYHDAYKKSPFRVVFQRDHVQPINVRFQISFHDDEYFEMEAKSGSTAFYNTEKNEIEYYKDNWSFEQKGKIGELIKTTDLEFIVEMDSTENITDRDLSHYAFEFTDPNALVNRLKSDFQFSVGDKLSTVVEISLKNESLIKGIDLVNELMRVSSLQNLEMKNHLASITIDYVEKQLNEISDSLNQTENSLQTFRSANQLLNITEQASSISSQYVGLQNQLAELEARKKYYDYVSGFLKRNDNFSEMIIPTSIGIQDNILNSLISGLITAEAQKANLIENNQEKNPIIQKLTIQIENIKKTISENISSASKSTGLAIDELNTRVKKIQTEIARLPATQRQLGSIERKYRLNDAIYNYMLEKRAEAKITKASNLPDYIIIEPAKMQGFGPVSPDVRKNYIMAFFLGLAVPGIYLMGRNILNVKVESQDDIEKITAVPVLGKILHNKYKTNNVMFEYPKSNIAESFRALRTNLEFYAHEGQRKVIMVTSSTEGEGKSFTALNLAMSYAQMGSKTILVDFDMRKRKVFFNENAESADGLSSYLINKVALRDIILKSPHENLDYVHAGILPPNPTELITLNTTGKLIDQLKHDYDYVILDTTPLAQVTDAYLLIKNSDVNIIVVRFNKSIKNIFSKVMKDLSQKKINSVCIVLNDNRYNRDQYGYGYGYSDKARHVHNRKNEKKS